MRRSPLLPLALLIMVLLLPASAQPATAIVPPPIGYPAIVNTTVDEQLDFDGLCSLREAILAVDSGASSVDCGPGPITGILFSLGSGTPLIQVNIAQLGNLPGITRPATIDGHTGTADRVEIRGPGGTTVVNNEYGLEIGAQNVTIKHLVVDSFRNIGIWIYSTGSHATLLGNIIGMDATGTAQKENLVYGVEVDASGAQIGGATSGGPCSGDCNLISGNNLDIYVNVGGSATIKGNFIGTDITGAKLVPSYGVELTSGAGVLGGSNGTTPGGACTGDCNLIPNPVYIGSLDSGSLVEGNFIGVDVSGTKSLAQTSQTGIDTHGSSVTIGGTSPAARNVISGFGIGINTELDAGPTTIEGNYIGTNSAGNAALSQTAAIFAQAVSTVIGGSDASAGNLISGNQIGVEIGRMFTGTVVEHNFIGTEADGTTPLPNTDNAVWIYGSSGNKVANNTIEFNGKDGVQVFGDSSHTNGNWITDNAIDDNGGLGINLAAGGNYGAAAPMLQSADNEVAGDTHVHGSLTSAPNSSYAVELLVSPACDPSGQGEGRQWVSSQTITTDGSGLSNLDATFSPAAPAGSVVTATATDVNHTTSAFSNCVTILGPTPTPSPSPTPYASPTPTAAPSPTPTPTAIPAPTPTPTPTPTPAGQTPTPTRRATATPTASPGPGEQVIWGDLLCGGGVTAVGALDDLRDVAGLSPLTPTPLCPALAATVEVQGFSRHTWGDVNCDGQLTAVDSLDILRNVAGLSSLPKTGHCPDIGQQVTVTGA